MTRSGDNVLRVHKHTKFATATILLGLTACLLAPTAAGSCISYGHSCWGAHGKRTGGTLVAAESRNSLQNSEDVFSLLGWMRDDDQEGLTDEWQQPRNKPRSPHPDTQLDMQVLRETLPTLRWLFQYKRQAAADADNRLE